MSITADDERSEKVAAGGSHVARVSSEQHTAKAYDLLAERYAEVWFGRPSVPLAERFLRYVPAGSRVVDVGCGPGQYTRYFRSCGRVATGVDISQKTVAGAMTRCDAKVFTRMTMTNLAFSDGVFRGVWACASLPHISSAGVGKVLDEFRRVLEPGGVLFVNVPLGVGHRIESPDEFGLSGSYGRFFERYRDAQSFLAVLEAADFAAVDSWTDVVRSDVLVRRSFVTTSWLNVIARCRPHVSG
ncbi:MAG: methyltransferase domain-containing protein [Streptomyces sp.]|nr:methyltransferase domain-containing protein [Streptomyces sp.]